VLGKAGAGRYVRALEVTRIRRDTGLAGILVQSPEPISWRRISGFSSWRSSSQLPWGSAPGPVKLTEVNVISSPLSDSVALLLLEDTVLTGARLEWRPLSAAGTSGGWTSAYSFGPQPKLRSGTRVIVYSSGATQLVPHPLLVKLTRPASSAVLPSTGVELRLIGPDGKLWHQRQFLPSSSYSSLAVRMVRKADGTGFVLFDRSSNALGAGALRLNIVYSFSSTLDAENPGTTQAGSTAAESAILALPYVSGS
jgi:hypothetical protein